MTYKKEFHHISFDYIQGNPQRVALLDKQKSHLINANEDTDNSFEEEPRRLCCCLDPATNQKTTDDAEWFLRAEVVKLTSHGILFNSLSEVEIEDEVEIFWPENHSLETALHMKANIGTEPPTFTFQSYNSGDFFKLRARFFDHIEKQDPYRLPLSAEVWWHIIPPLGCIPSLDSLMLAERMFLVSSVPNVEQMSHVLTEKFNIGGKSGAPFYFTHDEQYIIKMIEPDEMDGFREVYSSTAYHSYFNYQPNSLLLRVYGCHMIQMRPGQPPYYFLVMANVRPRDTKMCSYTTVKSLDSYDLKGSVSGRRNRTYPGEKCTLLDVDYLEEIQEGKGMCLSLEDKQSLMKQLEKDCSFLAGQHIMDYSLLVGKYQTVNNQELAPSYIEGSFLLKTKLRGESYNLVFDASFTRAVRRALFLGLPQSLRVNCTEEDLTDYSLLRKKANSRCCDFRLFTSKRADEKDLKEFLAYLSRPQWHSALHDACEEEGLTDDMEPPDEAIVEFTKALYAGDVDSEEAPFLPIPDQAHGLHAFRHGRDSNIWYYFGFIDITQKWNRAKRLESLAKISIMRKDRFSVSSNPPGFYAKRFLLRMNEYIQPIIPGYAHHVDTIGKAQGISWESYDEVDDGAYDEIFNNRHVDNIRFSEDLATPRFSDHSLHDGVALV